MTSDMIWQMTGSRCARRWFRGTGSLGGRGKCLYIFPSSSSISSRRHLHHLFASSCWQVFVGREGRAWGRVINVGRPWCLECDVMGTSWRVSLNHITWTELNSARVMTFEHISEFWFLPARRYASAVLSVDSPVSVSVCNKPTSCPHGLAAGAGFGNV